MLIDRTFLFFKMLIKCDCRNKFHYFGVHYVKKKILPGKTLIFLDEIQECQEAITSLKFWAIDNRYDVIVSGSLLGIDFEEFLWGMGISEDMIGNLCGYLELCIRKDIRYIFIKMRQRKGK